VEKRKAQVADDCRISYELKKNLFASSTQVKNSLQKVDISLSKSTKNRDFHRENADSFTTIPLVEKHSTTASRIEKPGKP